MSGLSLSGGLLESLESVESRENNIIIRHNNLFVNFLYFRGRKIYGGKRMKV